MRSALQEAFHLTEERSRADASLQSNYATHSWPFQAADPYAALLNSAPSFLEQLICPGPQNDSTQLNWYQRGVPLRETLDSVKSPKNGIPKDPFLSTSFFFQGRKSWKCRNELVVEMQ
jgi:hypothetical protein